jgi:hypothetical protein
VNRHYDAIVGWYYDRMRELNRKRRLRGLTDDERTTLARYLARIDVLVAENRQPPSFDVLWAHIQERWGNTMRKLAE